MYLTSDQITELVSQNQYEFSGHKYQSRCFSGHFENNINLPALALPGGDIGELAVLLSASISYGFSYDLSKVAKIIKKIVGESKRNSFQHSISFAAEECRYLHLLSETPEIFSLNNDNIKDIFSTVEQSEIAEKAVLMTKEKYRENACIIYEGSHGILPHYSFNSAQGNLDARVLIYHKTLIDDRRKLICRALYQDKVVDLMEGQDEEYLYEALSEVGDTHLLETIRKIDTNLPIYSAIHIDKNEIKVQLYS